MYLLRSPNESLLRTIPQLEWKDGGIEQLFTNDPNGVKPNGDMGTFF